MPAAGYVALRLPLPPDVLLSSMMVRDDGTLAVGSMEGDIILVSDADGDGALDRYTRRAGTLPHWLLRLRAERRYHRVSQGSYHSPPTAEQNLRIEAATMESDGKTVRLEVGGPLIPDRIYELRTTLADAHSAVAHYTMNRVPRPVDGSRPSPVESTRARTR